jgi:hypothetical protein
MPPLADRTSDGSRLIFDARAQGRLTAPVPQRRGYRKPDVDVAEAAAGAAAMQLQVRRDALEQEGALLRRQRGGCDHDHFELMI